MLAWCDNMLGEEIGWGSLVMGGESKEAMEELLEKVRGLEIE